MGKCFTRKRKPTTRTYIFNCLFFFFFYFVYNVYINRIHYSQKSLRYWASWCSLLIDKWSRAGRFTDKTAVWNFAFQFLLTSCAKKEKHWNLRQLDIQKCRKCPNKFTFRGNFMFIEKLDRLTLGERCVWVIYWMLPKGGAVETPYTTLHTDNEETIKLIKNQFAPSIIWLSRVFWVARGG